MLDTLTTVVAELKKILPTYPELTTDSADMPCITYQEQNNTQRETAESFGYSEITYTIKVWGYTYSTIEGYVQQVDTTMRALGFRRISVNELTVDAQIEKIMLYRALAKENFTN